MINFLRKIVDFTFYFICIVLIIYICIVGYQRLTNKDVVSFFDKYYFFEVASSSMESELHINDLIVVKSYDNYKVGDIITYKVDDSYVTHRIVSISDDGIITKGDANGACDEMISSDDVVGKYVYKFLIITLFLKYKFLIIIFFLLFFVLDKFILNKNKVVMEE